MKPRYKAVVHGPKSPHLVGKKVIITVLIPGTTPPPYPEDRWVLYVDEVALATCEYAKKLSDWAFDHGANVVRHQYDLKLSDWEP